MKQPDLPADLRDPTVLFEEYVRAWDAGQSVDMTELCARAGAREPDLKRRIEIFRTLQDLSDTLDSTDDRVRSLPVEIAAIGRFEKLVRIGQGGLSQVFLAHDPALKRNVALKILSPDQIATSDARSWIASEAQSLARLDHPGIVRVFEVDEADGFAYVAMEFLAGPSLAAVIDRLRSGAPSESPAVESAAAGLASIEARCRLVLQLARALHYCHEQGVVHRDVKPGNILLQATGEPKWIDFGLAHLESDAASLTQVTQRLMGTPAYIAPEQVDGGRTGASPLSDQFSLGVVLYELLTSKSAFSRPSRSATLDAISRADPLAPRKIDPSIPIDVERICLHALERAPSARYPSVREMADDLEAYLEHRPISLRAPSPTGRAAMWARRHRREIGLSAKALAAAAALALAAWILTDWRERSVFAAELRGLESSTDGLSLPQQFVERYGALRERASEARALDGSLDARVLGANMSSQAHAAVEQTSRRMSEIIASEWAALEKSRPTDFDQAALRLLRQWENALEADEANCPECPYNLRDRERGIVDLPAGEIALWQYRDGPAPMTPILHSIDRTEARTPGLYRVRTFDERHQIALEGEFLISPQQERRELSLRPLHPSIASRMIDVGRTDMFAEVAGSVEVAAHQIMREPVSWSDLMLAGWSEEDSQGAKSIAEAMIGRKLQMDDPATVEWDVAIGIAAALGARLPTGCELAEALREKRIAPPPENSVVTGELASSNVVENEFFAFRYDGTPVKYKVHALLFERLAAGGRGYVTFRLARSASE